MRCGATVEYARGRISHDGDTKLEETCLVSGTTLSVCTFEQAGHGIRDRLCLFGAWIYVRGTHQEGLSEDEVFVSLRLSAIELAFQQLK